MSLEKSEQATRKTFRLSGRLAVDITVGPAGLAVEWDPVIPDKLTSRELRNYRRARNEMLLQISEIVGTPIVVVDR